MPPTRPLPLAWCRAQPSPDRVIVYVVDHGKRCCRGSKVPIVPRPFLPKPKHHLAGPLLHGQLLEKRKIGVLQILLHAIREWPLDRKEELLNPRSGSRRKDEQVDMFWQIHESEQPEVLPDKCTVNAFRKQVTDRSIGQKGEAMKTREGQFMTMARVVEMPYPSAVRIRKSRRANRKTISTEVPRAACPPCRGARLPVSHIEH